MIYPIYYSVFFIQYKLLKIIFYLIRVHKAKNQVDFDKIKNIFIMIDIYKYKYKYFHIQIQILIIHFNLIEDFNLYLFLSFRMFRFCILITRCGLLFNLFKTYCILSNYK